MADAGTGSQTPSGNPGDKPGSGGASGNPTHANGSGGGGSDTSAAAMYAALSEENRNALKAKGWDSPEKFNDFVGGYRNLEAEFGRSTRLPNEGAGQPEWDKVHSKLGWPDKPEGYEFKAPKGTPENFPYDEAFAKTSREWFHEARVPAAAAQKLHDKFVGHQAEMFAARQGEVSANVAKTKGELVKDFGPETGEQFVRSSEAMRRALNDPKMAGLQNELAASGLIVMGQNGTFQPANTAVARLLDHWGKTKGMEDSAHPGGGSSAADNPWKDGPSFNVTRQGQIRREDPARARQLMIEAGKNPQSLGL